MKKYLLALLSVTLLSLGGTGYAQTRQSERSNKKTASNLKQLKRTSPEMVKVKRLATAEENAKEVPFTYAMGKDSEDAEFIKANFKVINANNDSRTWNVCTTNKYSSCMAAKSGESETADDWLITMPIKLEARSYKLSFDLGFMGATAKGASLEVKLGSEPEIASMEKIIAPEVLYTAKDQTSYNYDFRVEESGVYYIGFHCTTSVDDAGAALLYNFSLAANATAPDNAVEVPFKHELGKDSQDAAFITANYTTINANGDNRQWQVASVNGYTVCMAPNADDVDNNDDWLITMPIHMTAGNYTFSYDLGYMSGTGVTLDIMMGNAPSVEGMTTVIAPSMTYTEKDQTTYTRNFSVASDGYYYIGIHCTTAKDLKSAVRLFNIGVSAGETQVIDPPAAGTLTWVLAPKGELKATVTYTAPTKTKSGADLTEITKVELTSRWTVDKFEFTDVAPGQVIVQEVPMYQGINNRFTGVAYVGDVAGDMVEYKSIFCGKDTPLAPENVRLVTNPDFTSAVLSWDAVGEVGENGGYVDPEEVTYYIFDAFGSYYDPAIAETEMTSITLDYSDLDGQDFMAYQVTAGYNDNYSLDNASNIALVGTPAELPFTESFANGLYDGLWALDPATDYYDQSYGTVTDDYFASLVDPDDPDSPTPLSSFDGDNGFFYWLPYEKDVMVGLMSLRADISKAANPALEFRYQGQGSTIDVLLASGTGDLEVVKTIDLKTNPTTDWTLASIPLSDYKQVGTINFEIRLTATHNDDLNTWSVPIDAIAVRDLVATDVRIVSASASKAKVKPGDELKVNARIHNQGSEATDATAMLMVNGQTVAFQDIDNLEKDEFINVELAYNVPLNIQDKCEVKLSVIAENDGVDSNNHYMTDVAVQHLPYPTVSNLSGEYADGRVTLSWDAPELEVSEPVTIFEDFENEDYTPMTINGAGGFTVYDGDGCQTINVFYESYNPYQTYPMAFQLFNKDIANPYYAEDCEPHSGSSFMLAPTSYYDDNDNWLISPELSGRAQKISFYAKSFSSTWPESLEVFHSTTGNNPTVDFTSAPLLQVEPVEMGWVYEGGVPEIWTKYEVELPAGTRYFAIHHYGWYTCALFVDDITYEGMPDIPADLEITGYHVMRGDELITDQPVNTTSYIDESPATRASSPTCYYVIPVYNYGIGRASEVLVDVSTGIESIITGETGRDERYYTPQGILVPNDQLAPGIYIKVTGNKTTKVLVK